MFEAASSRVATLLRDNIFAPACNRAGGTPDDVNTDLASRKEGQRGGDNRQHRWTDSDVQFHGDACTIHKCDNLQRPAPIGTMGGLGRQH